MIEASKEPIQKQIGRSRDEPFQVSGVHLYRSMLVNQLPCQHESHPAAFSHQSAVNSVHHAALDANSFPNHKFAIRLDSLPAQGRVEKLDLGVRERNYPLRLLRYAALPETGASSPALQC